MVSTANRLSAGGTKLNGSVVFFPVDKEIPGAQYLSNAHRAHIVKKRKRFQFMFPMCGYEFKLGRGEEYC